MARKRMIDPEFWKDEKVGECTYIERLLFMGLWSLSDDNGVVKASPTRMKVEIFSYDTLRASDIEKSLAKLASLNMLIPYNTDGQDYYYIRNFKRYQSINKPTPSDYPLPTTEQLQEYYGSATVELPPNRIEVNRKEINIFFDSVWKLYPVKKGKGSVSDTQKGKLFKIGYEKLSKAVNRYISEQEANNIELQYYKHGSTFFNTGYIDYLDENYAKPSNESEVKYLD